MFLCSQDVVESNSLTKKKTIIKCNKVFLLIFLKSEEDIGFNKQVYIFQVYVAKHEMKNGYKLVKKNREMSIIVFIFPSRKTNIEWKDLW